MPETEPRITPKFARPMGLEDIVPQWRDTAKDLVKTLPPDELTVLVKKFDQKNQIVLVGPSGSFMLDFGRYKLSLTIPPESKVAVGITPSWDQPSVHVSGTIGTHVDQLQFFSGKETSLLFC